MISLRLLFLLAGPLSGSCVLVLPDPTVELTDDSLVDGRDSTARELGASSVEGVEGLVCEVNRRHLILRGGSWP